MTKKTQQLNDTKQLDAMTWQHNEETNNVKQRLQKHLKNRCNTEANATMDTTEKQMQWTTQPNEWSTTRHNDEQKTMEKGRSAYKIPPPWQKFCQYQ